MHGKTNEDSPLMFSCQCCARKPEVGKYKEKTTSKEEEEGGKTTVEFDNGQVLSDLLEGGQCENRYMEVIVTKNRENDLWDSYKLPGKHSYNRIPVPKIPKKLLGAARMIIEDHWLEFVMEHKTLLNQFFDYNQKYFDNWDDEQKKMYVCNCQQFPVANGLIDDMLKCWSRFQSHQRKVQQQQAENKENPIPNNQYMLIYNLYFNGNPRGC
jgi:hypothetical protein